jgi:hypothetical protein
MKKHLFLFAALLIGVGAMAQETAVDTSWKYKGNVGLNFSQVSFTNWAAGGQNALNWLGTFHYEINYAKGIYKWDNTFDAALGYSYFNFKQKPVKTDDRLEFTSLAGIKASEHWNYSLEFAFRSQMAKGFDYATDSSTYISKFLAPAYISLGVGAEWVPNEHFSINFAPITGRVTIVNDTMLANQGAFGVNALDPNDPDVHAKGSKVRFEFGARLAAKMKYSLFNNVDFESKLELFSNYLNHPERIDVDWQNLFVMKVNSWLNCNFGTHMIYDYDIPFYDPDPITGELIKDPNSKIQFKEVLSVGVLFNL